MPVQITNLVLPRIIWSQLVWWPHFILFWFFWLVTDDIRSDQMRWDEMRWGNARFMIWTGLKTRPTAGHVVGLSTSQQKIWPQCLDVCLRAGNLLLSPAGDSACHRSCWCSNWLPSILLLLLLLLFFFTFFFLFLWWPGVLQLFHFRPGRLCRPNCLGDDCSCHHRVACSSRLHHLKTKHWLKWGEREGRKPENPLQCLHNPHESPRLFLKPWAHRWINHFSLWRTTIVMPDLWLPTQPQGITALWPDESMHTHTHTTVLQLSGFCPGKRGWAATRRNIHPLTPIVYCGHQSSPSTSSIQHNPWHPPCPNHAPDSPSPQSLSKPSRSTPRQSLYPILISDSFSHYTVSFFYHLLCYS